MCLPQYESPSGIVYKVADESAAMCITMYPVVCMPMMLVLQITHCTTSYIHTCGVHNLFKVFCSNALHLYTKAANLAMLFIRDT